MSKGLLDWFSSRRERQVLENVNKHLGLTEDCVIELGKMIDAASEGELSTKQVSYERLSSMEREADELRRVLAEDFLTRGTIPTDLREDLMELVRTMDSVADWSKEAGRLLDLLDFQRIPQTIREKAALTAKELKNCVITLRRSINSLTTDPKTAMKMAYEVEHIEEKIDDMYNDTRRLFLNSDLSAFQMQFLILLNMFFDALEMVSDWCENTSDLVRVLAVRFTEASSQPRD